MLSAKAWKFDGARAPAGGEEGPWATRMALPVLKLSHFRMSTAPFAHTSPLLPPPPLLQTDGAEGSPAPDGRRGQVLRAICGRAFHNSAEFRHYATDCAEGPTSACATSSSRSATSHISPTMCSGTFAGAGSSSTRRGTASRMDALTERFDQRGFQVVRGPEPIRVGALPLPLFSRRCTSSLPARSS